MALEHQPPLQPEPNSASPPPEGTAPGTTAETISSRTRVNFNRPWLYPKQLAAIYDPARIACIEASTKAGKTVGCISWIVEQALLRGGEGRNFWWVAPVSEQALIAFSRMVRYLPRDSFTANNSRHTIRLMSGSIIWFKSGENPDSLYGEDVYAAVVDEASRVKEASWVALRTTLAATRGPVRLIGNVKGRKNWFYRLARRAEQLGPGRQDFAFHRITAPDAVQAGVLVAAEIEDARHTMPEYEWRQLFFAEAADDTGNPFGVDAIRKCIRPWSSKPPAVFGIDLARKQDFTVLVGLDEEGNLSRFDRWPPNSRGWGEIKRDIRRTVGRVPTLVDSTGVGDPIVEDLQRGGEFAGMTFPAAVNIEGYHFSPASKQKLMEGLAAAIQNGDVGFPPAETGCILVTELEAFEYVYTPSGGVRYGAPEGLFDDSVCALALASIHMVRKPHGVHIPKAALMRAALPARHPLLMRRF